MGKTIDTLTRKFLLIIPIITLCMMIISCDGNNNMISNPQTKTKPVPTLPPGCLDASNNSSILQENIECPTDALVQICNTFACDFEESNSTNPEDLHRSFHPFTCIASSCFDFMCDVRNIPGSLEFFGTGEFIIETVMGNQTTGILTFTEDGTQEMTNFDYRCSPLVQ